MATPLTVEYYNPLVEQSCPSNYWEGIVAPREVWPRDEEQITSPGEKKNWGFRVKVRIQGLHPADKTILPDDQLPELHIPPTVGSGHKKTGLSIGVTQGTRICGWFENPAKKEGLRFFMIIGNNDELILQKRQPTNNGFAPYSGFIDQDSIPSYGVPLDNGNPIEGIYAVNWASLSDLSMFNDATNPFGLQSPQDCEKVPLNSISQEMKELIKSVEDATAQLQVWEQAAQNWISDKQKWIDEKIAKAQEFIAKGIKWIFKEVRKFVEEQINNAVKAAIEVVNPPDRDKVKEGQDAAIELIVCLFNRIIGNLGSIIGNFLTQMLDRYINVPACAVENFLGSLLGNLLGALGDAIDGILGSLSSLLGSAFDLAGGILNFLGALLGFFVCEEDQECPDTKEWSIFDGGKPPITLDLDSILNSAQSFYANATNLVDIDNLINLDFGDLIDNAVNSANGCNVGPVFCGAPSVTFWGADGSGATGNVIVSAAGDILGVDLIASGLGYTKAPSVDISDNCGKGAGVSATAIMEPDGGVDSATGQPTYKVVEVVINDSGAGFIPRPDGDLGGDGRVWAPKDWTVVKKEDGKWEKYPPGTPDDQINAGDGDTVLRPEDRVVSEGGVIITPGAYPGGGGGINDLGVGEDLDDRLARLRGTTTIPGTGPDGSTNVNAFPTLDIGSYPVILYLCNIRIANAGINYSSGDQVIIEPNNGAEVIPTFGPFGVLQSLRIVNSGKGWVERPEIYIRSDTGYNAKLIPVFCVDRIGDDTDGNLPDDPLFSGVISVINCVGKLTPDEHQGYINGKPYYGPVHLYKGKKMMGQTHTNKDHPIVWDRVSDSISNYDERFRWIGQNLVRVVNRVTNPISTNSSNSGY